VGRQADELTFRLQEEGERSREKVEQGA